MNNDENYNCNRKIDNELKKKAIEEKYGVSPFNIETGTDFCCRMAYTVFDLSENK